MVPGDSEAVKLGGAFVGSMDFIGRWIVYRHYVDELSVNRKMTQKAKSNINKQAAQIAMDSFVDYRKLLPEEWQLMSDTGLYPFPHFTLRIQKMILGLLTERPLTSSVHVGTAVFLDSFDESIVSSALPFKNHYSMINQGLSADMFYPAGLINDATNPSRMAKPFEGMIGTFSEGGI